MRAVDDAQSRGGRRQCMPVLDPPRLFFGRRCAQTSLGGDAIVVHCGNGWPLLSMEICRTLRRVPRGELSKRRRWRAVPTARQGETYVPYWEQLGISVLACAPACLNLVGHYRERLHRMVLRRKAGGVRARTGCRRYTMHRPRLETRVAVKVAYIWQSAGPVPVI